MSKPLKVTRSLLLGFAGGAVAAWFDLPLAWMLGALVFTMVLSLGGVEISIPKPFKTSCRMAVGVILGAAVNPETLSRVGEWPVSLALVVAGVMLMAVLSTLYYRHVARFDTLTSVSASLPGAISTIPMIAIDMGADPRKMVLPHLFRITLIILIIPPLFTLWQGSGSGRLVAAEQGIDWWGVHLWALLLVPGAWYLGRLIRLPIPELTGPMILAAGLSLGGFSVTLPDWLFAVTFVVLGASIGGRFYRMPMSTLLGTGRHALVGNLVTLATTGLVALIIHWLTGVPLPVALLAVVPGGIAEMAILAAVLGVDPVFVTFHQIFRSVLINSSAPFILNRVRRHVARRSA
ncbi:AbrB family transcriptional regulator [Natronospirillum operosum]|nr:AbrB family transcriptional regulator [Natronospirillum operosum]